ncbi:hypothetical protein CDL12_06743 [Handroanthus impetiginosus]|uniref:Uncharacterized protein n=1 Tax=Handroanthus impetiginosus TaxID=429701 RepID=A0A2G9HSS7_9LAMI|nr:hypothetical protein CDL12_06743 [Handroanthus impetiginosus]
MGDEEEEGERKKKPKGLCPLAEIYVQVDSTSRIRVPHDLHTQVHHTYKIQNSHKHSTTQIKHIPDGGGELKCFTKSIQILPQISTKYKN